MPQHIAANTGRRYEIVPVASAVSGPRVRQNVYSPGGKRLSTVSESFTADGAEAMGLALIAAAAEARAQHARLTERAHACDLDTAGLEYRSMLDGPAPV